MKQFSSPQLKQMIKPIPLLPLFEKFILHSKNGKRTNKNGCRILSQSINNYNYCLKLLQEFESTQKTNLLLYECKGNNKTEHLKLKKHYVRLYKNFSSFLQIEKKCSINYAGQNIKMIRSFFNWVNIGCGIPIGNFHKQFYIQQEESAIQTLTVSQLQFLMFDEIFENSLSKPLQQSKDIFVFGCIVGLRFSDLCSIKKENIEWRDGLCYLKMRSQKTGIDSLVKLPAPAIAILTKYNKRKKLILPVISLFRFNVNIKKIGLLAGWTQPIHQVRSTTNNKTPKQVFKFCDTLSSHTMRRTSITTMLTSGMPEYIVRKISGHTSNSKAFFRYVQLAQSLMDKEIEKMHAHFNAPPSTKQLFE